MAKKKIMLLKASEKPSTRRNVPRYIGFRENAYGPCFTNFTCRLMSCWPGGPQYSFRVMRAQTSSQSPMKKKIYPAMTKTLSH